MFFIFGKIIVGFEEISKNIDDAVYEFSRELQVDGSCNVEICSNVIRFKRNYPSLPYDKNAISSFGPGEISINFNKNTVIVCYKFGLRPLFTHFLLIFLILSYFIIYFPTEYSIYYKYLTILSTVSIVISVILFNLMRARLLIKRIIYSIFHSY